MKINTCALLLIAICISSASPAQSDTTPLPTFSEAKFNEQINHYLKKSKNQKTLAWIFLGGGLVINTVGQSLLYSDYEMNSGGEALSSIGSLATIASIPLFFAGSKNKHKAQLVFFKKEFAMAGSETERKAIIDEAGDYFTGKARANTTTGIVLNAAGAAFVIGGIALAGGNDSNDQGWVFGDEFLGAAYIGAGIVVAAVSIPFYVRAAHHKRTAKMILKSGRFPTMEVGTIRPLLKAGKQVELGVAFQL